MKRRRWVGVAARQRVQSGGPLAIGRHSLSRDSLDILRSMLVVRARDACEACGIPSTRAPLQMEHALPRSRGGGDTWGNCWMTCPTCHRQKEAPYHLGRLLVHPLGDGHFEFTSVRGRSKHEFTVVRMWTGGRLATPDELAALRAIDWAQTPSPPRAPAPLALPAAPDGSDEPPP